MKFHTQQSGGRPKQTKLHQAICLANDRLRWHEGQKAEAALADLQDTFVITDAAHLRQIRRKMTAEFTRGVTAAFDNGMVLRLMDVGNGQVKLVAWWPGQKEVIESEPQDFDQAVTQKGRDCTIKMHFFGNNAEQLENLTKSPLYKR